MKKEILTGITGLLVTVLSFGAPTGNSLMNTLTIDMDTITYIEDEKPVELGFDTATYLPENFDAFGVPSNFMDISYLEEEDELRFDFDIKEYLPKGFDPHKDYQHLDVIPIMKKGNIMKHELDSYTPAENNAEVTF